MYANAIQNQAEYVIQMRIQIKTTLIRARAQPQRNAWYVELMHTRPQNGFSFICVVCVCFLDERQMDSAFSCNEFE